MARGDCSGMQERRPASRDSLPQPDVPTLQTGNARGALPMSGTHATPPPFNPAATSRDHDDWLRMWRKGQTDFHQSKINPLLRRFWHTIAPDPPTQVFVPLCGKSLDLLWLAAQGLDVIGVELSPIAVSAFFSECGLKPITQKCGKLTRHESGRIRLFCGDFFRLRPTDLGNVDAVYDRAALTALPADLRPAYVAHLRYLITADCPVFLVTVADSAPDGREDHRPAHEVDDDVFDLYDRHFHIDMTHRETEAPELEHTVYHLTPRPA